MRAAKRRMTLGEGQNSRAKPMRQDRAEFLDAGLEKLGDAERLAGPDAHASSDPRHSLGIDLGLRDADHVLI